MVMPIWGRRTQLSVDHGAYVASVAQNGAALAAAILVGDVIAQLDNTPVRSDNAAAQLADAQSERAATATQSAEMQGSV